MFCILLLYFSQTTRVNNEDFLYIRFKFPLVKQVSYLSYPNHTKCEGAVRMLLNLSLIVFFVSRYVFMIVLAPYPNVPSHNLSCQIQNGYLSCPIMIFMLSRSSLLEAWKCYKLYHSGFLVTLPLIGKVIYLGPHSHLISMHHVYCVH